MIHLIFENILLDLTALFKFKIQQIKFGDWFMQDLLWSFLNWKITVPCLLLMKTTGSIAFLHLFYSFVCSNSKNVWKVLQEVYKRFGSPFLRKYISDLTALLQIWNSSIKNLKLVHAGDPVVLLFLIWKLWDITSSCSDLF